MFRLWIYIAILSFFMMIGAVFANEVISKDPNYIKNRGSGFEVVHIANYKKSELKNHNYSIIKDPTGKFKMIESISPRKGDCGNYKSFGGKMGGQTDCNSDRLRLEIAFKKELRTGKKAKEIWIGYYLYVPDTPDNFKDKKLQPYITQFYGTDRGKTGQNRGGYGPQYSASIYNGKLTMDGMTLVDKENLKGKGHLVEFNILYSRTNGYVRAYINGELKVNRENFQTSKHSHVEIKYGSYSHPEYTNGVYPEGYQFSSHTIYFAKFSIANKRSKLLTSK